MLLSSSPPTTTATATSADIAAKKEIPLSTPFILDPQLETKIKETTKDLLPGYRTHLLNIAGINAANAAVICDYIAALKVEVKPADHYRRDNIELLTRLAKKSYDRNFKNLTRQDIILFLQSFEKREEIDPLHKWVSTYNLFRIQLFRFFKWLYSPHIEQKMRPKPSVI